MVKRSKNPTTAERLAVLERDMDWVKKNLQRIDNRLWWILGSVVVLGIIGILTSLLT